MAKFTYEYNAREDEGGILVADDASQVEEFIRDCIDYGIENGWLSDYDIRAVWDEE